MATIIKKIKKNRPYYYAVESKRVNGKPRIVWQKYLGTIDSIVRRADQSRPPKPKETVIFDAGGAAGLLRIAQRIGLMDIINDVVKKRNQGPTVGHYMILAALNRALAPCSKKAIGEWYENTVLRRLWGFNKSAFSSQRFWDHMDRISEEDIQEIQERLFHPIKDGFGLDARVLLYDTTNFFTFLATSNARSDLAQRGHSKQKRNDLRQVGLALLVTRDFQIPLFHRVYEGNTPDVSLFPDLAGELVSRFSAMTGKSPDEATLVFDKGNVSDDAMEELVVSGAHFVSALSANRCADLLSTPMDRFRPVNEFPGCSAFDSTSTLWGKECKIVVVYTESFFARQLQGVSQHLVKCQKQLLDLSKSLEKWRQGRGGGRKPTLGGVQRRVREILSPQFMKQLMKIDIVPGERSGCFHLHYGLDHDQFQRLNDERLGKTAIVTNHLDWSACETVGFYRSLSGIEEAFKNMKNVDYLRWQPAYHWTDQKIRVHGFYCVLGLLLSSLARKVIVESGVPVSLPELLKELNAIREVAVIYPRGTLAHRKDHITLSRMTSRQKKFAQALEIGEILRSDG